MKKLIIISALFFSLPLGEGWGGISFAQNKNIDSLLTLLKKDKVDTNKVIHSYALCREYTNIGLYDTALHYCNAALELAKQLNFKKGIANSYYNSGMVYDTKKDYLKALDFDFKALKIAEEIGNKQLQPNILGNIGLVYKAQSDYPKALDYFFQALKITEEIGDKKGSIFNLDNIGNVYNEQGDYPKVLGFYFKALEIAEELGNKKLQANTLGNIGENYRKQGSYPLALENYLKSLKIDEEIGDKQGIAFTYNNIGIIYWTQNNYQLALENYLKCLKILKESGNKYGEAATYANIGLIYHQQGNYAMALENHLKSLKIFEAIGYKQGIEASYTNIGSAYLRQGDYILALKNQLKSLKIADEIGDKNGIARSYINIGEVYEKQKLPLKAIEYSNKGLALAKKIGSKESIKGVYETLSKIYIQIKDYKKAYENFQLYSQYKDSLVNEESSKQLGNLKTNYAVEKKEIEMKAGQEIERTIAKEKSRKQKIIIWSVACGLLLVLVFAGFIFRSLRITRQQKNIIEIQKNEVSEQKAIVEKQKHLVEEHQKEIIDSITYAKRLQKAILPRRSEILKNLPESFILYKPKDIVAGDFYWAEKINDYYYIAAADCTGHGVPGAMVSMVCSNALNRTVNEFGITETGKILDNVRELVLEAFKKSGEEIKDGMDISLLRLQLPTPNTPLQSKIQWSGANNSLLYFLDNELQEIKADKQPIGKYEYAKPFTTHNLELNSATNIYLITDGFADQFGINGKKIMKKTFKEELLKIHHQPMTEQKKHLNQFFESWKGNTEQVDDVTVIGIRI